MGYSGDVREHHEAVKRSILSVQAGTASRILLYLFYFFAGVGIGAVPFDTGLLASDSGLARRWPVWLAATIASYGCIIALIYIKHSVLPDVHHQPLWWEIAYALAFVAYGATQTFNILALFLRFDNDGSSIQYVLYGFSFSPVMQLSAIIKAIIVLVLTLALSWAATAALRKIPAATRVL